MTSTPDPTANQLTDAGTAEAVEAAAADEVAEETEVAAVDERLLSAHALARAALAEITDLAAVGAEADAVIEGDGLVSLRFASTLRGYPGWFWTVTLGVVEGAEPTVLELGLLPGDDALVAPEWIPWAVRLAEYQAAQAAAGAGDAPDDDEDLDDDEDVHDLDDVDDLDADDFDTDGSEILHSGDVDGVDIDELDAGPDADDHDEHADDTDEDADDADESDAGEAPASGSDDA